jgi:copper oxidase (laccase) domain-containing protein
MSILVETFPALTCAGFCQNAFLGRVTDLDVALDRAAALARLEVHHNKAFDDLGFDGMPLITAEQIHGNGVAIVGESTPTPVPRVDALITNRLEVCLGIYVADCCAVYALDIKNRAIGLAHSGRKGTEMGVVPAMLKKMQMAFGTEMRSTRVVLSPCIRPPFYEVDFAAEIARQCLELGVKDVVDAGYCTASEPNRYYSYRLEKGKTGRMLALFALIA